MTRYMTRDRIAIAAAVAAPLVAAVILLPWRGSWSNTNVALLLLVVVVVVAVAVIGNRAAGALAALGAAAWFDFFFTVPYQRFMIRNSADVTTSILLLAVGVTVSPLAARARRLKVMTITDAGYLTQVHESAALAGMPAEEVELRTFGNGQYYGRFMLTPTPGTKPALQARVVAVTLADLAGRALGSGMSDRAER